MPLLRRATPPDPDSATAEPASGGSSVLAKIGDRIFPVRPGPVPPWTRVISLVFLMAIIWEVMWLITFWTGDPNRNLMHAWSEASKLLPIAVVLATVGAVPGFWLMRRRMEAANVRAGLPPDGKVVRSASAALRTPRATEHASSRGRRRYATKKRVRR